MSNETIQEQVELHTEEQSARLAEEEAVVTRLPANPLSEREMDVAEQLVTGATNNEIAEQLVISPHTVKVHLRNIYEKLGVNSRTEASTLLIQQGWVTLPGIEPVGPVQEETPAAAPPEPEPLADTVGTSFAWQPFYLLGALVVAVALLLLPPLAKPTVSVSGLLNDGTAALEPQGLNVSSSWGSFETRAALPIARSRFALVPVADGKLYAIGGEAMQGKLLPAVSVYASDGSGWRHVEPLPFPLSNLAATTWAGLLYVAGGTTGEPDALRISDVLLWYDPGEDRWQSAGQLPFPLAGASLVSFEDSLYLLGGWDGQRMHDEVWRISLPVVDLIATGDWELVTHMAHPHAFGGAVVVDQAFYVAGGYDGQRELDIVQRYLVPQGEWEELPPLASRRSGLQLVYDGRALFAVGGGWVEPISTIERFDLVSSSWSSLESPIAVGWRNLGAAATEDGFLYFAGGWAGNYLSIHMQLRYKLNQLFLPGIENAD